MITQHARGICISGDDTERVSVIGQWHGVFEYGNKNLKVIGTLGKRDTLHNA
jgi:tRNA splicing ligase